MSTKVLGVRPFNPRRNCANCGDELPLSIYFKNDAGHPWWFDHCGENVTITFNKFDSEPTMQFEAYTVEYRGKNTKLLFALAKFLDGFEKFLVDGGYLVNSVANFMAYLATRNIPIVFYYDGKLYSDPNTKMFRWFNNGYSQGTYFAMSQGAAIRRVVRAGYDEQSITVEEIPFGGTEHMNFDKSCLEDIIFPTVVVEGVPTEDDRKMDGENGGGGEIALPVSEYITQCEEMEQKLFKIKGDGYRIEIG